jgi:HK97 family phage major capsid protein
MKQAFELTDKARAGRLLELGRLLNSPIPGGSATLTWPTETEADLRAYRDFTNGMAPGQQVLLLEHSLRPHSAIVRLGAEVLNLGVQSGNHQLACIDRSKAGSWGSTPADVAPATPLVLLQPKRVWASIVVSTRLIRQSGMAGAALVEGQLLAAIGSAIDRAAIQGTGLDGEPVGLLTDPAIQSVDTTTFTFEKFAEMERLIGEGYGEVSGELAFLMDPELREDLKTQSRVPDTGGPSIWEAIDCTKLATPFCPAQKQILGDFSQLAIGHWGAVDLLVNPFSLDDQGFVRLTASMHADIIAARPESFVKAQAAAE